LDPPLSKVETVHEINVGPALSPFCVCFCVEEGAPLLRLLGAPSQRPPLLLRRNPSVAPSDVRNISFQKCAVAMMELRKQQRHP
jgi:hypothetical protein